MFKWKKLGRIFNPTEIKGIGWMKEFAQAPSVVVFEKFIRVYFSCRPLPDKEGKYISHLAYVDLNRDDLFKVINVSKEQVLELGKLGTFDEFGTYPASVIKNGDEIRVYYAGWTRCESVPFNAAIGMATSHDNGKTFTRLGNGPILSYSVDEPFVLGSPKIRRFNNLWYLWYSAGTKWVRSNKRPEPVYKIRMAHSADGINWIKNGKDLIKNVLEENECQASADVFSFKGQYRMFFSYRYNLNFKEKNKGYRIGYAFSDDLVNWTRDDTRAGIEISKSGWDSESISYPHIFELDNNIYMLYQGNQMGKFGFGIAQLISYSN